MELGLQTPYPIFEAMAEFIPKNDNVKRRDDAFTQPSHQKRAPRSGLFKYYIHDGLEACRLQLFGEFTELEVPDLIGCWNTVKTTLGQRPLVLDIRQLRAADDAAKRWLFEMAAEGASFLPETYLRDGLLGDGRADKVPPPTGLFARLVAILRGPLTSSTPSSE